jgi:hypothetical protein
MSLFWIRTNLASDCANCDSFCCIAPSFETSTYQKVANAPCQNLNEANYSCDIYGTRKQLGYTACGKFECHGAGQATTKFFKRLKLNAQSDKHFTKFKNDIFVCTYNYLSAKYFSDEKTHATIHPNTAEQLKPFLTEVIKILSEEIGENI